MDMDTAIARWVWTALGAAVAALQPALPYCIICTLAILYDCYTAWQLGRRVRQAHPDKVRDGGKFTSHNAGKVIVTLLKAYALIVLAYLMHVHITGNLPINVVKVAAGAICFWQLWSILENESSCNGAKWAKMAQKILVDKTSRHFDINLKAISDENNSN